MGFLLKLGKASTNIWLDFLHSTATGYSPGMFWSREHIFLQVCSSPASENQGACELQTPGRREPKLHGKIYLDT